MFRQSGLQMNRGFENLAARAAPSAQLPGCSRAMRWWLMSCSTSGSIPSPSSAWWPAPPRCSWSTGGR